MIGADLGQLRSQGLELMTVDIDAAS